jgi:multidrug efflux pump
VIYHQFSITIVSAMLRSVIVALVLTPALTATLLKPVAKGHTIADRGFFGWFNRSFNDLSGRSQNAVRGILGRGVRWMAIYGAIIRVMAVLFVRLPTSFLPEEDQGTLYTLVQLPPGATDAGTQGVLKPVETHFQADPAVKSVFTASAFSFAGAAKNAILIVEVAKALHDKGMALVEATLEAVRIRLRSIIMTSLAFIFGVLPLAISNGAGSGSQHAIGTGVIGGMISAPR